MRRVPALLCAAALIAAAAPAAAWQTPAARATPTADLAGPAPALDAATLATFDEFVGERLAAFGVPGAAVAVVQGGDRVFAAGYGVREAGGNLPVTPDTLMLIGSVTKSMTAAMAATVVDDGYAAWDDPVVRWLPGFATADPALTERITLADAFCACTGIPRRDAELILNFETLTPDRLIAQVADLPVTAPFGEEFQYSNQVFGVGGYAAARAAGAPLDDLLAGYELAMEERILAPLGMERSAFDLADVLATGDYATPHAADLGGDAAPIRLLSDQAFVEAVAPAGGLWSSAAEMADYVRMQLADGIAPDGRRIVSAENLGRTRAPRVAIPVAPGGSAAAGPLATSFSAYGMGWGIGEWRGLELVNHSGGTLGFAAEVAFLPDADLGVVVLTNGGPLAGAFAYDAQYRLFELAYGLEPEVGPYIDAQLAQRPAALAATRAALGRVDPTAVAPFVGAYAHPVLGDVTLRLDGGRLFLDAGELSTELLALNRGRAYAFAEPPLAGGPGSISLRLTPEGTPEVVLDFPADDGSMLTYVFSPARAPAPAAATPAA